MPIDMNNCYICDDPAITALNVHLEGITLSITKPGYHEPGTTKTIPVCRDHNTALRQGNSFLNKENNTMSTKCGHITKKGTPCKNMNCKIPSHQQMELPVTDAFCIKCNTGENLHPVVTPDYSKGVDHFICVDCQKKQPELPMPQRDLYRPKGTIKCGKCKDYHNNSNEVRACYGVKQFVSKADLLERHYFGLSKKIGDPYKR